MTKSDLTEIILSTSPSLQRSTVMQVLDAAIKVLSRTLASGESVYLRSLGTFKVREVAPKTARNIAAGTSLLIPAHKTVKFIPSQTIKDSLKCQQE